MILKYDKTGEVVKPGDSVMIGDKFFEVFSCIYHEGPVSEGAIIVRRHTNDSYHEIQPSQISASWHEDKPLITYELKATIQVPYDDPLAAEQFVEDILTTNKLYPSLVTTNKVTPARPSDLDPK